MMQLVYPQSMVNFIYWMTKMSGKNTMELLSMAIYIFIKKMINTVNTN